MKCSSFTLLYLSYFISSVYFKSENVLITFFFARLYVSFHLAPAQDANKIIPRLERIQTIKFIIKHNTIIPDIILQQEGVNIFGFEVFFLNFSNETSTVIAISIYPLGSRTFYPHSWWTFTLWESNPTGFFLPFDFVAHQWMLEA